MLIKSCRMPHGVNEIPRRPMLACFKHINITPTDEKLYNYTSQVWMYVSFTALLTNDHWNKKMFMNELKTTMYSIASWPNPTDVNGMKYKYYPNYQKYQMENGSLKTHTSIYSNYIMWRIQIRLVKPQRVYQFLRKQCFRGTTQCWTVSCHMHISYTAQHQ